MNCITLRQEADLVVKHVEHTQLLSKTNQLSDRQLIALYASNNGPLALIIDRLCHNTAEVFDSDQAEPSIIAAVENNGTTSVEVIVALEGLDVLRCAVWACEVVREDAGLEEAVFEDLFSLDVHSSTCYEHWRWNGWHLTFLSLLS
jgi:hypothetical protein